MGRLSSDLLGKISSPKRLSSIGRDREVVESPFPEVFQRHVDIVLNDID